MDDFHAVAPKIYRYRVPGTDDWKAKAKGLHAATADDVESFAAGEPHTVDTGVKSFLQAARAGGPLFIRQHLTRSHHPEPGWMGDRRVYKDRTYPVSLDALQARDIVGIADTGSAEGSDDGR